jgi:hypothetical protein
MGENLPKYNVFLYPRFRHPPGPPALEISEKALVKINEIGVKYRDVWSLALGVFDKLPPEDKTPNKLLDILEKHFQINNLAYASFRGLEAANEEEAEALARRYATNYAEIHEKMIPEEFRDYITLDGWFAVTLPYVKSVKLDPPNIQNQNVTIVCRSENELWDLEARLNELAREGYKPISMSTFGTGRTCVILVKEETFKPA